MMAKATMAKGSGEDGSDDGNGQWRRRVVHPIVSSIPGRPRNVVEIVMDSFSDDGSDGGSPLLR